MVLFGAIDQGPPPALCAQVIKGCGVIQSDGIDIAVMRKMCGSLEAAGFSAENITYGMGGGLLQKVGWRGCDMHVMGGGGCRK